MEVEKKLIEFLKSYETFWGAEKGGNTIRNPLAQLRNLPAFPSLGGITGLSREYVALKILLTSFTSEGRIPSDNATIDRHIRKSMEIADAFINACQQKSTEPPIIELHCNSLSAILQISPDPEGIVARVSNDVDPSNNGTWVFQCEEGIYNQPKWYRLSTDPDVWVTTEENKIVLL